MSQLANRDREHEAFAINGVTPPNPLLMVPETLRKPLSFFWMLYSAVLPSITPVAALLATWIDMGLDIDDAKKVLRRLATPASVARMRFRSDLISELAYEVSHAMRLSRTRELIETIKREGRQAAIDEQRRGPDFSFAKQLEKHIARAQEPKSA